MGLSNVLSSDSLKLRNLDVSGVGIAAFLCSGPYPSSIVAVLSGIVSSPFFAQNNSGIFIR